MADEIVAVVDGRNRVVGAATRKQMRLKGLAHRATYILVFNERGELFVHQRTETKDVYPGFCCVTVGGVVAAGEDYEACAYRELGEELGITGATLDFLFELHHRDGVNDVWGRAYRCSTLETPQLQEEEIQWGRFLPIEAISEMMEKEPFTPDGKYVLARYTTLPFR